MKKIIVAMAVMTGLVFGTVGFEQAAVAKKKIYTKAGCKAHFGKNSGKRARCKACVKRGGKFKKRKGGWWCKR